MKVPTGEETDREIIGEEKHFSPQTRNTRQHKKPTIVKIKDNRANIVAGRHKAR